MPQRNASLRVGFILLAFGLISLLRIFLNPSLQAIRGVDIAQLLGAGACLGGAVVAIVLGLRFHNA